LAEFEGGKGRRIWNLHCSQAFKNAKSALLTRSDPDLKKQMPVPTGGGRASGLSR